MNKNVLNHFKKEKYGDRNLATVKEYLGNLNIDLESNFAKFFLLGKAGPYFTNQDTKDLEDLNEIIELTSYVAKEFKIPDSYVSIGSTDGESLLLYNKNNDSVFYIGWNEVQDLINNNIKPTWESFDEYLTFYFS